MGRLSIIVNNLGMSDLNYSILKSLNDISDLDIDKSIMFESIQQPFFRFPCSTMSVGKIWSDQNNDGLIIATSLNSAEIINGLPTNKKKILYIWQLEFLWGLFDYFDNVKIYKSMPLVTRSESYADCIENYCGIRPKVIKDFNLREILNEFGTL